jgi:adenine-specific DNA methylase
MSQEPQQTSERTELPIERGFPIERVNEIAAKEGRAKMYYRPIYTMHKWWARRLGCVFRAICLYTLLDDPEEVEVYEPGHENETLAGWDEGEETLDIASLMDRVEMSDPESLWELYPKDVRVEDKKVLDPFMGGGTSLVEASRFGAEVVGNDLNPVAWFVTKKQLEAGQTDVEELEAAFEQVKEDVAEEIKQYYRTPCPNGDHEADVMYYFWVKELDCTSCGENVPLFKDYRIGKGRYENKGSYNVLCPECESAIRVDNWQSKNACTECGHSFVPEEGNAGRGDYTCQSCGQKYGIVDAIQEQGGFDTRLYGLEYYCPTCDENDEEKGKIRSYKGIQERDIELTEKAKQRWEESEELREYIPNENIPLGIKTDSAAFEGSIGGGFNVLRHGYDEWADMFNERQLFALATLLKSIDELNDQNAKEYLLLAVSDALRTNCMMVSYDPTRNGMGDIFRSNSFNPPLYPAENNVWGSEYGRGTFKSSWEMVKSGVEYGLNPTDRVVTDGSPEETEPFDTRVGENFSLRLGDARTIPTENEYDAVITDPPYYDNVIYSELSDFFYIWLKILLEDEYEGFSDEKTPRTESIVANPAVGKGAEEFEDEITQAFAVVRDALKNDGILTFTYHHADSESWGELLNAICEVGFEVTATYPITADISKLPAKLGKGDSVSFDIIVVARPIEETTPASWKSLRREIYRTARRTRQQLEENRDLSRGDIGVMEMGACFREYSRHHGKVQRDGEIMDAKEVVQEIYGIIQEAGDIGVEDVFLDLLDSADPSFDDVNKLCRGTSATSEELKEMALYNQDDGFELGTWDNEKRQAYIQERTNGGDDHLSNLDKLQFLRYRYEKGQAVQNYVDKWGVDDNLRELAGRLADVTGDDTYTRVLGDRDITSY